MASTAKDIEAICNNGISIAGKNFFASNSLISFISQMIFTGYGFFELILTARNHEFVYNFERNGRSSLLQIINESCGGVVTEFFKLF